MAEIMSRMYNDSAKLSASASLKVCKMALKWKLRILPFAKLSGVYLAKCGRTQPVRRRSCASPGVVKAREMGRSPCMIPNNCVSTRLCAAFYGRAKYASQRPVLWLADRASE